MSAKHTPGPWKATCRDMTYKGGDWSEDEFLQWEVEGPRAPFGRGDFFQADARLIAAAPDLLEALHAMLSHTAMLDPSQGFDGFDHSAVNQARAAIAKAEGERK